VGNAPSKGPLYAVRLNAGRALVYVGEHISATATAAKPRTNGTKPKVVPSGEGAQRELLSALRSVAKGDFTIRLSTARPGIDGDVAEAFNDLVTMNARLLEEVQRISDVVGRDGRIAQRASLPTAPGAWSTYVTSVNELIDDLTHPIAETSRVLGSVARGDFSQQMVLEVDGRAPQGRVSPVQQDDQHDGRSAQRLRLRGNARRA
jgi:hypothetical protein